MTSATAAVTHHLNMNGIVVYAALHGATIMKPNWSCITCGMYSSRRYSVQRHINNMHSGDGTPIPFMEYLVGRRSGKYPAGPKPVFGSTDIHELDEMTKEFARVQAQRVVDLCLPPPGHPSYLSQANILKRYLAERAQMEKRKLWRESLQFWAGITNSDTST